MLKVPAAPLWLAFCCVGANGLGGIAGDALFVTAFSLGALSKFVGIAALVRVASSFAYAAIVERILDRDPSPEAAARVDAGFAAVAALGFVASAIGATSESPSILYAVCLAQLVLPPILPLVAFNAAAGSARLRDAKRVLPLVAAAATAGSIATAAAASLLAKTLGLPWIFALGGALSLVAAGLLRRVGAKSDADSDATEEHVTRPGISTKERGPGPLATLRESARDLHSVAAVRVVVGFAFFGALALSFIDYAFKASLKASYPREDIAAALGVFGVVSNAVVLALQLAITGPLVGRLGVGRTMATFPALLTAASVAAFALPAVIGTGLTRLAESIVRYGVGNSVADVLLVPLARSTRTHAKIVVKGVASPLGALAAAGALSAFGADGPPRVWQLGFVVVACGLLLASVRRAPAAYAGALGAALARGRRFDVSPEGALVFRSAIKRQLEDAVLAGRFDDVRRTLELMTDRLFEASDAAPALRAGDPETRRLAITTLTKLIGPATDVKVLSMIPIDDEPTVEVAALTSARERGVLADTARLDRAIEIGEREAATPAEIELWAEAVLQRALLGARELASGGREAQVAIDAALKRLRKAAQDPSAARRAAALTAIGVLGDRRAEREVRVALASTDAHVFRAAAESAMRIEASGAVAELVARLVAGPHPAISARALALAGPRAVRELVAALPVTRGEGAIAPTAVAEGKLVTGTVRAARALARIGESASREVLPLYGTLGHRARTAVARAFAAHGIRPGPDERKLVEDSVDRLVQYGRTLLRYGNGAAGPLLRWEISRRKEDTIAAIFDLASTVGDRSALQRGRMVVLGSGPTRDNALELIETVLSAPGGAVAAAFLADATSTNTREPPSVEQRASIDPSSGPPLDGWLEKCRQHDARELSSSDPMASVLDRVLILREVPLFRALSGEDLYPVAEIATVEDVDAGRVVVKQGDPSEDLYVVIEGRLSVDKDGARVGELATPQTFGELGVLDGEPRAASVRTETPCRLLRIPRSELEALLDESPELAKGIIVTLLGYVRSGMRT